MWASVLPNKADRRQALAAKAVPAGADVTRSDAGLGTVIVVLTQSADDLSKHLVL
jgi:hypothetical protein